MMLPQIEHYWTGRAKGYSEVNQHELATGQDRVWLGEIRKHLPKGENLKILDVGTGPGFFAILLARAGYDVTAVDYTEAMLAEAKKNAGEVAEKIHFQRMDAQRLDFPDGYFDVVISRNLTWNLECPEQAYAEWMRVLKEGGRLLNFDANWYHHLFDEEKRREYEEDRRGRRDHRVLRPPGHRRRHRPGGSPDRREAEPAPGDLRLRDQGGGEEDHRAADAGGRLHDHRGGAALPADLHQGAQRAPLHERGRHRGGLQQALRGV